MLARCSKVLLSSGLTVPLGDDVRPQILAAVDRITLRGLRCLAFGVKTNLGERVRVFWLTNVGCRLLNQVLTAVGRH